MKRFLLIASSVVGLAGLGFAAAHGSSPSASQGCRAGCECCPCDESCPPGCCQSKDCSECPDKGDCCSGGGCGGGACCAG